VKTEDPFPSPPTDSLRGPHCTLFYFPPWLKQDPKARSRDCKSRIQGLNDVGRFENAMCQLILGWPLARAMPSWWSGTNQLSAVCVCLSPTDTHAFDRNCENQVARMVTCHHAHKVVPVLFGTTALVPTGKLPLSCHSALVLREVNHTSGSSDECELA
jgi:hypothetical protein